MKIPARRAASTLTRSVRSPVLAEPAHAELTLESFEHNEQANTFYRNRGWLAIDNYHDKETGISMISMVKRKD